MTPDSNITQEFLAMYRTGKDTTVITQENIPNYAQLNSYRRAATVLHCFNLRTLNPDDPSMINDDPLTLMMGDVLLVSGGASSRLYTLKLDIRREVLKSMSTEEMKTALRANTNREMTSLQALWEAYIQTGVIQNLDEMSYDDLVNLGQIALWLNGIVDAVPLRDDILDRISRRSMLASIDHLVDKNFRGRLEELRNLREYLGLVANPKISDQAQLEAWSKGSPKNPIATHGPGGVGKSSLIGKLMIELCSFPDSIRMPLAYMAFDQPSLRIESPFTILVDAVSQFQSQFPHLKSTFDSFNQRVRVFRDERGALINRLKSVSTNDRLREVKNIDERLYTDFVELLSDLTARSLKKGTIHIPATIVLDTFEEVQYRDRESLLGFWQMLSFIHRQFSPFRLIILGRASIVERGGPTEFKIHETTLSDLRIDDRISLLLSLGVKDTEVAMAVAEQIGGNPLSLRLAANVITSGDTDIGGAGFKDLTTKKWMFFQIDEQLIQGQLYKRILKHIHNKDVQKLAHPGMVLRQVDPEIILYILAPVCNINVNSFDEATLIFEELRREHSLVKIGGLNKLIYRPEIRQSMVRLLAQDRPQQVKDLHRAAIAFYSKRPSPEDRAEEIFHTLALGEATPKLLDERWIKGIEQSIVSNLDEYSDGMKVLLASRVSLEIDRNIFLTSELAEWERNCTRKVKLCIAARDSDGAIELLGEREKRTNNSPLFALEARALMMLQNYRKAAVVLNRGIETILDSGNRGRLAELYWLQAQVALGGKHINPLDADKKLALAEKTLASSDTPAPLIHILSHRLLLRREYAEPYTDKAIEIRSRLARALRQIDFSQASLIKYVIKLALDLLYKEFPDVDMQFAETRFEKYEYSRHTLTSENLRGLEAYRERWENENDDVQQFETLA